MQVQPGSPVVAYHYQPHTDKLDDWAVVDVLSSGRGWAVLTWGQVSGSHMFFRTRTVVDRIDGMPLPATWAVSEHLNYLSFHNLLFVVGDDREIINLLISFCDGQIAYLTTQ